MFTHNKMQQNVRVLIKSHLVQNLKKNEVEKKWVKLIQKNEIL